jgi:hypothetical protein
MLHATYGSLGELRRQIVMGEQFGRESALLSAAQSSVHDITWYGDKKKGTAD